MKFYFKCEVVSSPVYEVEAETFEKACLKFGRKRLDGEHPDEEDVSSEELTEVCDENGTDYDPSRADELAGEASDEDEDEEN
jgi:hypothetical protein